MNKIRKSFALCASVATFMHASAEKIYKAHILRTATITRTSKNLKHQIFDTCRAQNLYAKSFQKTSPEWCKIPPISARSCGMIVWDHQHFTRSLGSRSLSSCVTLCYAKTVRGSRGHVCAAPAVQNLTFTSHSLPHGLTHLRCGTPGETTITSSRPNQPMPRKTTRTFLLRECTIHAKPRSWTTLAAATAPCIHFP